MNDVGGKYMKKMRIYEYAKEKNVASKEVITKLKEKGFEVSNHMSVLDSKMLESLEGKSESNEINKKGRHKREDTT